MTAEVKSEENQMGKVDVSQQEEPTKVAEVIAVVSVEPTKVAEETTLVPAETVKVVKGDGESKNGDEQKTEEEKKNESGDGVESSPLITKISSFKEESNLLSDLKVHEKKALAELKLKVEEAILENKLFKKEEQKEEKKEKEKEKPAEECKEEKSAKEGKEEEKPAQEGEEKENQGKGDKEKEIPAQEGEKNEKQVQGEAGGEGKPTQEEDENKEKLSQEEDKQDEKPDVAIEEKSAIEVDKDIAIWGVPLLPSKQAEGTDVVLLKFLRARDFKVNEAFEMLKNTLQWRKENKIDSILDEDLGANLSTVAYMNGVDQEGHPVCYNIYGVFQNDELYQKTFGTEEKRQQFLRWRFQLMEKGIQKLDLKPGGVSSLLQINDLKNSPGPSKKELRLATKQAVSLLQDNYPEFVSRNIFINVPFWYYAFNAVLSPFLTQRTKSKFVFARPSKVTETLLKYIPAEEIPIQYGGLKRENDSEFSIEDAAVSELTIKGGSTETIEIPVTEVGSTILWDLFVLGWEVNYKEEFIPSDEGSYTIVIQKGKKIASHDEPIRNSFRNNEPGKVVLTIENGSYKKRRGFYRSKTKNNSSS